MTRDHARRLVVLAVGKGPTHAAEAIRALSAAMPAGAVIGELIAAKQDGAIRLARGYDGPVYERRAR